MSHLEIGNATYKEIQLRVFEDIVISSLKKKKFKKAYTEEEAVRDYIRDYVFNTKSGKKILKRIYDSNALGIGYKGLWALKIGKSVKHVKKRFDNFLKTSNRRIELDTYQDVLASIFMTEINGMISEEVAHAECDYRHEGTLSKNGRNDLFLDFVYMKPIKALKRNNLKS
jgi:hypothetical protein